MASRSQNGRLIRPKKKGVTSLRGHTLSVRHNNYRAIQSTELYRPNHIAVKEYSSINNTVQSRTADTLWAVICSIVKD